MKKVTYALIGFGGIAENRIAKEGFGLDSRRFHGHPDAELKCATDVDPARQGVVEKLGIVWRANLEDILDDPDIEAVFIATNNLTHAPIARQALSAGKHCLIDKPMAATLIDAEGIVELARERKLSVAVDHMMVCNAYNVKAKEMVAKKILGDVDGICLHMEFLYGATPEEAAAWRCANPDELGGPIGDVASHCLYMAEFLSGNAVESLACVYTPRTLDIRVENGAFIQFRTQNGIPGSIRVAFNQPRGGLEGTLNNLGYEIYGSRGVLRGYATLFQLSGHAGEAVPLRLELDTFRKTENVRPDRVDNIYQAVIAAHARSIRNGAPMDGSDALHNLRLVVESHRSARSNGAWIRV